ncbi:ion transporter [Reichenbachiella carrageenanivorans]|uniref:Ion transporter n=1 Tax=Reichenbachiella carrageenanivorans TaxID=2979869 RepID=A0ABY6D541_9BACT|nr:ion transporter [Reichenbachiella carrageenanivorans]UXX80238.1 ion transporter [Reichenbachiella carrageenanivorans]
MKRWQQKIHEVIFGYHTTAGRVFDLSLLVAIVASVLVVMLESVKDLEQHYGEEMRIIEWVFTFLFSIEYIARIVSSPRPLKYITSFMGIVDLLSLIPTYLSFFFVGTHSLSVIRSFRLIRVFRILKLTHFMGGAQQLATALWGSRHKIIVFMGTVSCIVVIAGTMMYLIEGGQNGFTSIPKSIYWAIVTITTVGYGDIAPQTIFGQTAASILMILGYAIIAVPTGIVTSQMMADARRLGTITCSNCGEEDLPNRSRFCLNCASRLNNPPDQK